MTQPTQPFSRRFILLTILLFLVTHPFWAQDVITLSNPITQGQDVNGCEGIILSPGFKFTATPTSVLTLKVDPSVCALSKTGFNPTQSQNYITTITPLDRTKTVGISQGNITLEHGTRARIELKYFDGLGRINQTILRDGGLPGQDLASYTEYDNMGREWKTWLPANFPANNGAYISPSLLKSSVPSKYNNDPDCFNETRYEASPLNRVNQVYGPGNEWKKNNRAVSSDYQTNTTANPCAYYRVSGDNLIRSNNYSPGELYVTRTTDENNHVSFQFRDKLDRVVLERRINNQDAGGSKNYDTYFVYNDLGELCYVLPPLASDATPNGTYSPSYQTLADYAYLYRYDERGRCKEKKLPGTDWISMVYDRSDRLVLSQDGVQKGKRYTFYKYDSLGRLILTGEREDNTPVATYRDQLRNLLITETKDVSGLFCYTNISFPTHNLQQTTLVNYYDKHDFTSFYGFSQLEYKEREGYDKKYSSASGLLTGTLLKLQDGSGKELLTVYYYDEKGQIVQQRETNYLGGFDYQYYAYNFDGTVTSKFLEHTCPGESSITESYTYNYDHVGRLKETYYSLNGEPAKQITANSYNNLGQLEKKVTGGLETTGYQYNLRGWLEKQDGSRFSQQLFYNTAPRGDIQTNFNGNISAIQWKMPQDKALRGLYCVYDDVDRLTYSFYGEGAELALNRNRYDEYIAYDKHGNIKNLTRYGRLDDYTYGQTDILEYQIYKGNQVTSIQDWRGRESANDLMEFKNYEWGGLSEYTYDGNGNMISDLNRKIRKIEYNYLNLPKRIEYQNGSQVDYVYDANGIKHSSKHYQAETGTTTSKDYIGNKVYENGKLKMVLTENGYKEKVGSSFKTYYTLKDHLGSNRMVLNYNGEVVQATNYYSFGASFAENPARIDQHLQPYKYNGKELDRMFESDSYDYGARTYLPVLGRFTTMDPLAEKYYSITPYAYCGNNPINRIDPTGMDWYTDKDGTYQYDPELTKKNQADRLQEGQAYVGATHKVKENGKVIENYRKDGSIMYSNEASGYKRVWNNTQKTGNEEMGVITDNGVLVLPSYKNDAGDATPEKYGYSWENGNLKDADGNSFSTLGTLHTHPNPDGDKTASIYDVSYFSNNAPNKPYFVLMADQKISSYMSYPKSGYGGLELPKYNGVSPTLPGLAFGKYPLMQILKQNRMR